MGFNHFGTNSTVTMTFTNALALHSCAGYLGSLGIRDIAYSDVEMRVDLLVRTYISCMYVCMYGTQT